MTVLERDQDKVTSVPAPDSVPPPPPEPPPERNQFEKRPDGLGQITIVIPADEKMTL